MFPIGYAKFQKIPVIAGVPECLCIVLNSLGLPVFLMAGHFVQIEFSVKKKKSVNVDWLVRFRWQCDDGVKNIPLRRLQPSYR